MDRVIRDETKTLSIEQICERSWLAGEEGKRRTVKAPVGANAARSGNKWSPGLKHGPTYQPSITIDGIDSIPPTRRA